MKDNQVPCPVCGTYSFFKDTFPGSYDICPVCLWEDDSVQFTNPDYKGGANDVSLTEAKENFKKYGIIDLATSYKLQRKNFFQDH